MTDALLCLLNMKATRFRITESKVFGVTEQSLAASTGIAIHVQPLSPDEAARAYGYEDVGARYQAFVQSTADVLQGDRIKIDSVDGSSIVSFSNTHYHVRGLEDNSVWAGIAHKLLHLELTEKSTA